MTDFSLHRGGALLHGIDRGAGKIAVVFQHGLGGSEAQVAENFPDGPKYRRLTLECRGQGRSPAGDERPFSIRMFVDDVLAACAARGVDGFVAGGISMGAAIALNLAVTHPGRVRALILARPAWRFDAAPANMHPYTEVAEALRRLPPDEARKAFAGSDTARMLAREAPDNLASLLGFFDRPDPAVTADLLGQIARDGPGVSAEAAARLRLPTLVIGNAEDHAHPLACAADLARVIPGARLVEIPPKASRKADHVAALRATVDAFLGELAVPATQSTEHSRIGSPT
jgi:pimeloyl-ACP methyl ester carboxylesterase